MTKYTFILYLLIAFTVAQTCFKCKPQACTINGCTDCQDGFMLSSQGWCALFTPIQGCRVYNASDNSQCVQCNADRQLINSRCYLKPDNCEISDQFRQCLNCNVGFQIFKGRCFINQIQNCPLGSLPSYLPDSVPAGARLCQPLRAQNCLKTSDDGNRICLECQPGFTLINGRCLKVISNTSCSSNTCSCPNGFIFRQICYRIQIDKCNILRDPVYCMACQQGFVAIDGICLEPVKQEDINCNIKAPDSDYCTGCNQDYTLDIDGFCYKNFNLSDASCPVQSGYFSRQNGRCYYKDRRCESVLFTDINFPCLRCQEGFTLKNKICQRNICIQQRADGICQQAFIGFIITGPNQFQKLPTNCLQVDSSNNCLQCSPFTKNLSMISGQENPKVCAYQTANCTQYNSNGSCIQCLNQNQQNGYILRGMLCLKKAQNCLERDKNDLSKCVNCLPSFRIDSIERICYENIPGCEVYLRKSDCKQCEAQIYILYQNKCFSTNKQCIDYDSKSLCRRCSNGLMPFKNRCVYYHPFCLQYGVDKVCSLAANGWTLGNGMTESQKNYYTNFMIRGQQVTRRNQTANLTGVTASSSNQVGAYDQGGLITRFPYANLIHPKISGVNLLGQISSCNQGFTLINQACIRNVVPNCELYSIQDICIRCAPQHTLIGNFTCTRGLQCSDPRFIVNGRCQQCARGSILMGAQCFTIGSQALIDQQLQSGLYYKFTYPDGTYFAWPRIANCNNQLNPVACSQCQAPYQNINSLCVIPVDRCIDYGFNFGQSPGICRTCTNGFVYWFGQCRQLTCSFNSARICNSCPNNFYYYFSLCLINRVNNCLITQNATCVQCNYGYYLNLQNQCQSTVSGCLQTNTDTGRCLQCRSNLVLYRERCVPQVRFCVDYDSNNVCIRCQRNTINNTQLMSDGTCALLEGQCAKVDQKTRACGSCNLGYTSIIQDNRILCVNLRPNCQTYDIRGRCTQCNPRFVLINNQCRLFLQNCLLFTPDGLNCTRCTSDTQLDAGCCKRPDPNCINYNQCICTSCMTTFYLNNQGICVANPTGCNIYDFVGRRCKECATGFYLLTNGLCLIRQDTINGCLPEFSQRYDPINGFRCVRCVQGFQLRDDGLCYAFNCIANNLSTRQCINCPTYYQIYQAPNNSSNSLNYCIPYFCNIYIPGKDKCQSEISTYQGGHIIIAINKTILIMYCKVLDNITGKCISCNNFRYPNNNTLFNLCYPLNCLNNLQFNCLNCQFGYELNPLYPGSCVASFCSDWKQDGTCKACNQPYTLSSAGICQNKGCCQQYDTARGVCRSAKKFYAIQGSICVPVNCLQYDSSRLTVCSKCAVGYTLFADGTCRVTNCQVQTFLGESCVACRRGFEIKFSTTFLKTVCNPRNCTQISDDLNTCLKCQQGFTLDSDKLCRSDYCSIFRNDLICSKCIDYFILGPDFRCSADCSIGNVTRCQCCKFDFTLNIKSGLCQPISSYCTSVNPNTGLCNACATNYLLLSGRCIAPVLNCRTPSMFGCLSCNVGYEIKDNCRCIPKFCKQMGDGGRCAVCHPRFELMSSGLCMPRDCQTFSIQTWSCNSCYSRFSFENGVCVSTNCQLWDDFQNTTCKKCLTGSSISNKDFSQSVIISYNLTNGACYIKYCANDPRQLYCKQCLPGFNLTLNGLCQCPSYDANNICICSDGYIYDNSIGQCIINLDVCLQRNSNGTCLQCPFQYQRPSQNKGECIPLYCSRWQNVSIKYIQCRACFPNFNLVNGFCQSSLCLKFQNRRGFLLPQCNSCQEGYSPTSNFCVPNNCQRLTYNLTTGLCAKCNAFGYVLSADGTRCITANCRTLVPSGQCTECLPGYINFTKLCIASNCTLFDEVTCKGCLEEWFQLKNELCYANNCQNYGPNNFCTKCNDGYVLARNYTCLRKNCDNDAKEKCLQCSRGFIYNSDVQRCTPINCQVINAQNDECDRCRSGYFKQNGTCLDIFCDLSSFTSDFKCLKCQEGYSFNSNGLCFPVNTDFCPPGRYFNVNLGACISIPTDDCLTFVDNKCMRCADDFILYKNLCYSIRFCLTYSYFGGCLSCVQGFYLDSPQCKQFQQDPNCIQNTIRQCIRCRQGYQLDSGRCWIIPSNCVQVDSNGRCIQCSPGFSPANNSICQSNDPNCLNFYTNGRCAQCRDGFYPAQRICQQNPINCIRADPLGKCIQCAANFDLQNGICYKKYANCATYSQKTQFCIQCATNFTLLGIQCICALDSQLILNQFCIKLPANCLQINANTFRCVRCARNHSLSPDFKCVNNLAPNPPQNCRIYDPLTGICTQCFPNNILSNNTCQTCRTGTTKVGNECFVIIIGCFQYLMNGGCKNCVPGYNIQNAKCVNISAPPFCDIYDPKTGICQKCIQNYNLTSRGCVINNCLIPSNDGKICNKCIDLFNWNGRQCQYQTDFCLSYSRGNCQSCENFAILRQNRCVPKFCNNYESVAGVCTSCIQKYQLISRRCFLIIVGCQDYFPQGSCRNCLPGFTLSNSNICQKQDIPQFCTQYNFTTTVCLQCAPGYALTGDSKLCILNNCQLMDPTGMICNRCRNSFQWNAQLCVYITDFCLVYGGAFCTNCTIWSRLDRNRCVPSNCLSYNYNIGTCQNCANGFTIYQKRCFTIIMFCIAYGDNGNCVQCQNGYVLSRNGLSCAVPTVVVPNCFAQSTQSCLRCRHRYYLQSQMCSQYIPYCTNIDIAGKCISCCFGSTLINSICQRDQTIKNCLNQIGRTCQQCANGFRYCDFCEACLPQTPNCNIYNSEGGCISCVGDFSLANGICIAPPVGFVTGTAGTCRTGYYSKDGNCYKNTNQLSSYPAIRSSLPSSISASFFTAKSNSQTNPLIIFSIGIQLDSQSNNASFLLYYRSKALDPFVCWNSCIPTTIDRKNYLRQLIYPIIANQVNIYLIGRNLQSAAVDFRILS